MKLAATARQLLVAALIGAALAGCGPPPPQPPAHAAKKLGASTGDISTECGLSYQITAFPGGHAKALASLETQAKASARSLASVYNRNSAWIFQGDTVRDIVGEAVTMLRACGLSHAAGTLERLTSGHRS